MPESGDHAQQIRTRLAELMRQPEEKIGLADAALVIASAEYPGLDPAPYLARLDSMASIVATRLGGETDSFRTIEAINRVLYEEERFSGNSENYYDPRNSFLNDVLDRRTGIPITLSTIYLEVAERLGFPLVGVGLPGHFLVKHPYFQIIIDPFDRGCLLSEDDCRERVQQVLGDTLEFHPSFLDAVGKRHIVIRILNNLRAVYYNARQYTKALEMTGLSLAVQPGSPAEHKQRAGLLLHLGRYAEAVSDLNFYLEQSPPPDDAEEVRETLAKLRRTMAQMN